MGDPAVQGNFVELRRVTSELADIDVALAAAEDAWLELEERAPVTEGAPVHHRYGVTLGVRVMSGAVPVVLRSYG